MTSVGAHAVSTGRQDENVTDNAANRMRRVASHGGGDDIVADVREELDRPALVDAARSRDRSRASRRRSNIRDAGL
jgi:hypothetical protein